MACALVRVCVYACSAAPNCREKAQYCYEQLETGEVRWQYPDAATVATVADAKSASDDDDAMDISTTPPHNPHEAYDAGKKRLSTVPNFALFESNSCKLMGRKFTFHRCRHSSFIGGVVGRSNSRRRETTGRRAGVLLFGYREPGACHHRGGGNDSRRAGPRAERRGAG